MIYFGDAPLRMPDRLDTGAGRVRYRLLDIRQFEAMEVAAGGAPADLVLATLAHGGRAHLRELLARMIALPPALRNRALAQVALGGIAPDGGNRHNGDESYGTGG